MTVFIQVDTLHNMLTSPIARARGFQELISNGYAEDMKDMYGIVYYGDDICDVAPTLRKSSLAAYASSKKVRMAYWSRGRLYDSATVIAYTFPHTEGWWVVDDGEAEWAI